MTLDELLTLVKDNGFSAHDLAVHEKALQIKDMAAEEGMTPEQMLEELWDAEGENANSFIDDLFNEYQVALQEIL